MSSDTTAIESYFRDYFANWDITLPSESVTSRRPGHIFESGWHIGYLWGKADGVEYFEFLAQHRMTNDRRHRVYASGRVEDLETATEWMVLPKGATPDELKAVERRYFAENRRISADLHERGLLPPEGENLSAIEINEYLRSTSGPELEED